MDGKYRIVPHGRGRVTKVARLDPTNRLLAVIDDPVLGLSVVDVLVAAGIPDADVEVLAGVAGAERVDALGRRAGRWLRLKRLVALTQADQAVDLAMYEAALRDGRVVIAVRPRPGKRADAIAALRDGGAHFINRYGSLVTEEIEPWRGERPPLPDFLQR